MESKPLVSKSYNLKDCLIDGSVINSVPIELDSTEKIDVETVAYL
ncbi:3453_t:CDS:2 [Acaulospora colombiana]|uniref:3453_t:CDS:1 n=1 Tax=Acaulospora colombiana TaxID=27376 RepID=A0ACA9KXD3_9GLOM|nr:3453_t:CDS:2 [Acaulospora colombiana]